MPSGWPLHGQSKQLWLGSGLGWPNWAGSGSEEGFGFLLPFTSLSSRGTVTRGRGRSGGAGPPRAPGTAGRRLVGNGHPRSQGQAASPRASILSWRTRSLCRSPEASSPRLACSGQGRAPREPSAGAHLPPPGPTPLGLWIPLDGLRRKCQRSCAIGGDGQLFRGLIKLERRMGGPGAGEHRPAGALARPPGYLPPEPRISRCCGRRADSSSLVTRSSSVAQRLRGPHSGKRQGLAGDSPPRASL